MSLLEIENIKVQNDTQLAYYEHVLGHLASAEVSGLSKWRDIVSIMTLLMATGSMFMLFVKNADTQSSSLASVAIATILIVTLGYAGYAAWNHYQSKKNFPKVKENIQNKIQDYKKSKGESK
ncbi:MAG: hypothetical protein WC279_02350 [Sulfurimonas sp.]|jgi:uncharacterized membrane protein YfhO|uniref:hypothetical protein n=1 Tax=Sulfurimonas sp. TaxID=2022749 RepID=UPI0035654339